MLPVITAPAVPRRSTRAITGSDCSTYQRGDHGFFMNPPAGFADHPLLTPRGSLIVAAPGDEDRLAAVLALSSAGNEIELISAAQVLSLAQCCVPNWSGQRPLRGA